MRLLGFGAVALLVLGGCGLTLDFDPPDDGGIGFDARVRVDAGSPDAGDDGGVSDAGPPPECAADADCDDGDVCDGTELCLDGQCAAGTPLECEDAFDCTIDGCDAVTGCTRSPDPTRCEDDGVECTLEQCVIGSGCVSQPDHTACADSVRCTSDVCDTAEGCVHHPVDALCAAGNTCDVTGGCDGLACESNTDCADVPPGPCETGFTCVASRCVPTLRAAGESCEDGNPCTTATCTADGACRGVERVACEGEPCWRCNPLGGGCDGSLLKAAGTSCEDGNLCTSGETCDSAGECSASIERACLAPQCRTSSCDPATGGCISGNLPSTTACDDFDPCTSASSCDGAGSCSVHTPLCEPNDPTRCTNFRCNVVAGVASCLSVTLACVGRNRLCLAGSCVCAPGFQDCGGDDGDCECNNAEGFCAELPSGSRVCTAYMECRGGCISRRCCPCTGECCDATDVSCCAGCPGLAPTPA